MNEMYTEDKAEVLIFYWKDKNMFIDIEGNLIGNIFQLITPNDLLLYKDDSGNDIFPHRHEEGMYCRIIEYPGEDCGGEMDEIEYDCLGLPFVCSGSDCRLFGVCESERYEICTVCGGGNPIG